LFKNIIFLAELLIVEYRWVNWGGWVVS